MWKTKKVKVTEKLILEYRKGWKPLIGREKLKIIIGNTI